MRHGRAQVVLRRHVDDSVVREHDVEAALEPQRPHVADDVLALRVQGSRQRQHRLGDVRERAGEPALEVARVVAAAGTQLEQRPQLALSVGLRQPDDLGRLVRVVLRSGQQVEPSGELRVEAHHGSDVSRLAPSSG